MGAKKLSKGRPRRSGGAAAKRPTATAQPNLDLAIAHLNGAVRELVRDAKQDQKAGRAGASVDAARIVQAVAHALAIAANPRTELAELIAPRLTAPQRAELPAADRARYDEAVGKEETRAASFRRQATALLREAGTLGVRYLAKRRPSAFLAGVGFINSEVPFSRRSPVRGDRSLPQHVEAREQLIDTVRAYLADLVARARGKRLRRADSDVIARDVAGLWQRYRHGTFAKRTPGTDDCDLNEFAGRVSEVLWRHEQPEKQLHAVARAVLSEVMQAHQVPKRDRDAWMPNA